MTLHFTEAQFQRRYPRTAFGRYWFTENKVVLQEIDNCRSWFTFFCKRGLTYEFIIRTPDFDFGKEIAQPVWHPKAGPTQLSAKNLFLEHIESMVISLLKKQCVLEVLSKFDFSVVYYSKDRWQSFYPATEELIKFHLANNKDEARQNKLYLALLRSPELQALREEWDKT